MCVTLLEYVLYTFLFIPLFFFNLSFQNIYNFTLFCFNLFYIETVILGFVGMEREPGMSKQGERGKDIESKKIKIGYGRVPIPYKYIHRILKTHTNKILHKNTFKENFKKLFT